MLMYPGVHACFEHSNFLKVTVAVRLDAERTASRFTAKAARTTRNTHQLRLTTRGPWKFNYELFNGNNFNIRYWSWNYRGCWHQTCPPIVPR